jgi:hypothetical protein
MYQGSTLLKGDLIFTCVGIVVNGVKAVEGIKAFVGLQLFLFADRQKLGKLLVESPQRENLFKTILDLDRAFW